jgi:hypothetical protein
VVLALALGAVVVWGDSIAAAMAAPSSAVSAEVLARENPLNLLELARSRCRQEVRDYRCVFTKKEFAGGEMRGPTVMQVLHRQAPLSVLMTLRSQSTMVKRALWVQGTRFDSNGEELMLIEPGGWRRLLVSKAEIPIHDERILEHNRSTIEDFGFLATLDHLCTVSETASQEGDLDLRFDGRGSIDGRPTLILSRRLPYGSGKPGYPDALTILHLDEEWLLPVSMEQYADPQRQQLLASYQITEIRLNPGLRDSDFSF